MNHSAPNRDVPKHIIIVGGGTAGWMSACLLHHAWSDQNCRITLVESQDIGTIGVGEGSTPYLRQFFRKLGISENEWMPACDATYKCGIRFPGWSTHAGYESYFHPFFSHLDAKTGPFFFDHCERRRRGENLTVNPTDYFVSSLLAEGHRAPIADSQVAAEVDYGYHFDAGLLGKYLRTWAKARGVNHCIATVANFKQDESGNITDINTQEGMNLQGDFFVDCSGFAGLIMQKTLKEDFIPFNSNLFNDRAVAISTPTPETQALPSETVSSALSNGWAWRIPLTSRFGNGYVYASEFISEEEAERELREHLGPEAQGQQARHLKMRVGRIENHWRNNCLAIGLSQGFVEPLEATALMLVQLSLEHFIKRYQVGRLHDQQQAYNHRINTFFEGIRDYIVAHYKLNSRDDSAYWIANRENSQQSTTLKALLHAWDSGMDFDATLEQHKSTTIYQRPSWYCILAGMGRFGGIIKPNTKNSDVQTSNIRSHCQSLAARFPAHYKQIMQFR